MATTWMWPFVLGYGIGSIPFAWVIVRGATGLDLRRAGSGNVGAANALRATGWSTGVIVALLDLAKGVVAVVLAGQIGGVGAQALGAVGAVVGHVFPVWLRFQGGKGVATSCGAFAVLAPGPTLASALVFLAIVWWTRIVSLGSLVAVLVLAPIALASRATWAVVAAAATAALLVVTSHRANMVRLVNGRERRLGEPGDLGQKMTPR